MTPHDARALFERLLEGPDGEVDLLRVCLAIAAEDDAALDVEAAVGEVEALAARALEPLPDDAGEDARLRRLGELLFLEARFSGKGCDFDDPRSSFLHEVLRRRTGLPIALSVLFMEVGRRMGLRCAGVGFPGHFIVRAWAGGQPVLVDAFHQGRLVTAEELAGRLGRSRASDLDPDLLADAPVRQVVARMLRNLKNLHLRRDEPARAFAAVDRLLVATPDVPVDLRDRGLLCLRLGGLEPARADLERYLALRPRAPDAALVRRHLVEARRRPSLLN